MHYSSLKNLQTKTMIFVTGEHLRLDIAYDIYDLRSFLVSQAEAENV
jgi:hypothetical protein